ncbi:NIPSNAP family protein [Streptomyces sp. NPDC059373]
MCQHRVYTLRTHEGLAAYQDVWARHIPSLAKHGITTHGVWTAPGAGVPQLHALVSYADGDDPQERDDAYMASPQFRADLAGFDMSQFVSVTGTSLAPTDASPLR